MWLFTDKEGYVRKRKADFSPQTRIQILKAFEVSKLTKPVSNAETETQPLFVREIVLTRPLSWEAKSAPNGSNFIGNVIHVSPDGTQVKPATKGEVMECLKGGAGAVSGVIAVQPYVGLKTHNAVYRNRYELKAVPEHDQEDPNPNSDPNPNPV